MKLINDPTLTTNQVWFLNNDMVDSLESANVSLDKLDCLPSYLDKMSEEDVIFIGVLQRAIGSLLGCKSFEPFDKASQSETFTTLFNVATDSDLRKEILDSLKGYTEFYVKQTNVGIIVCLSTVSEMSRGWVKVNQNNFSNALLEAIYQSFSYTRLHFQYAVKPKGDEFSVASVLKLVA